MTDLFLKNIHKMYNKKTLDKMNKCGGLNFIDSVEIVTAPKNESKETREILKEEFYSKLIRLLDKFFNPDKMAGGGSPLDRFKDKIRKRIRDIVPR